MRTPYIVKNLLIANCVIFLAATLIPALDHRLFMCQLFHPMSPLFHTWQFVTYMFLHGSFQHLFFNMFALWMFGRTLEWELGEKRFLTYYVVCGVGAALFQILIAWLMGETQFTLLGASGAVMGLLLAFGMIHPNERMYIIPIPVPIKAKWFVVGYAVLELVLGITGREVGVAHFAHIGGMLWGWALLTLWKWQAQRGR